MEEPISTDPSCNICKSPQTAQSTGQNDQQTSKKSTHGSLCQANVARKERQNHLLLQFFRLLWHAVAQVWGSPPVAIPQASPRGHLCVNTRHKGCVMCTTSAPSVLICEVIVKWCCALHYKKLKWDGTITWTNLRNSLLGQISSAVSPGAVAGQLTFLTVVGAQLLGRTTGGSVCGARVLGGRADDEGLGRRLVVVASVVVVVERGGRVGGGRVSYFCVVRSSTSQSTSTVYHAGMILVANERQ